MKLSTKSRYGIRAMLYMATNQHDGVVMTHEIAERQNLPETYLEQLMLALRKAGILSSIRGAHGGYMLANRPEDISIADIIIALEGTLNIADCADVPSCCFIPEQCALRDLFDEANAALHNAFSHFTLADLAQRQRTKEESSAPMYHI